MLKLLSSENQVLQVDDFYILEKSNGLDELVFNISIYDENYPHILEEAVIEYEQPYLVKAIDGGSDTAKVKCQLDLDELKADMRIGYSNNSSTLAVTVNGVLPAGWVFVDNSGSTISRTIEGDYTPLEIIIACAETYDVVFRFKPKERQVYAYSLASFKPFGAFASRELNLKEINYKGKSTDLFTRLYAFGEDGLSFADINNGKEYVECFDYTDKIICAVMRDERYTTKDGLLEAAQKAVKAGGIPTCSYECTVYDLAATNPEMYSFQDFSLFSVVKLIDDIKETSINHQVMEYKRYPKYPEKNVVTLSTTATKLQNTVKNLENEIENPQSAFRVLMQNTINNMAASIAGYDGGNMIITKNADGKPNGIMIMDTESQATAKHVLWFNLNGITYSAEGVNGPYNSVWSFNEGGFIADWIIAGQLDAALLKVGAILDATGKNMWDLENGLLSMKNGTISVSGQVVFKAEDYTEDDATIVQELIVGTREMTAEYMQKYDFTGKGYVDGLDLLKVRRLLLGAETQYTLDLSIVINALTQNSILRTGAVLIGMNGLYSKNISSDMINFKQLSTTNESGVPVTGDSGSFTTADGKTVNVSNGIITGIV